MSAAEVGDVCVGRSLALSEIQGTTARATSMSSARPELGFRRQGVYWSPKPVSDQRSAELPVTPPNDESTYV
jgi:hypothetical protein